MEERKYISEARSKKNGIVFYSNICPMIGTETFRDDSGTIHSRIILANLDKFIDYLGILNEKDKSFNKRIAIVFDAILISLCLLLSKNLCTVLAAIYFSVLASFDFFRFVEVVYQMKSKKGKERSTARFHAAEHMVINAYEKLQRVPTFDEVKKSSRFSKECGSRNIINKLCFYTLISLTIAFAAKLNSLVYCILIISIFIFTVISKYTGWLRFMQVFITTPPSDSEIELAIEGVKAFEKMEEKLNNKDEIIIVSNFPILPPPFLF